MNNRILFLIIVCIFAVSFTFAGCGGDVFDDGVVKIKVPNNWESGSINASKSYVYVKSIPKESRETLQTMMNSFERNIVDPTFSTFDGGVIVSGEPKETLADARFILGDIIVSKRDIDIEAKRIDMIGTTIQPDQLENIAEVNVIQNGYFMLGARTSEVVIPEPDVLSEMELSFDDAVSAGSTKEGFLFSWGITEDEFKKLVHEKLAYSEMIIRANNSFPDLNEGESAAEFLTQYSEIYELKEVTSQADFLQSVIIEKEDSFLIIEGVSYSENERENVKQVVQEFLDYGKNIPFFSVYIFSEGK